MSTIFEETMNVCLEGKREKSNKTPLNEKAKVADKAKAPIVEKKTTPAPAVKDAKKKAPVKEAVAKKSLKEDDDKAEMGDIADDIVVVIDPEKTSDDLDDFAKEMQDIVQDTPEGEQPSTDEYVGDSTYSCPVCGNTFFSEEEMAEGTQCPVCGETPQSFVLVGKVEEADEADDEDAEDEVEDAEGEEEPDEEDSEEEADEDLELGDDEDFKIKDEEEDDKMEENRSFSSRASKIAEAKKRAAMKTKKAAPKKDPRAKESTKEFEESKSRSSLSLDEKTFNPFLTKFITDNYRNATAFEVRSARINGNALVFECAVKYKSGAVKKVTLESRGIANGLKTRSLSESINSAKRIEITMKESSDVFKAESKGHPFTFTASVDKGIIRCEGLKYDFVTKSLNESFRVYGGLIKESAKKSQAPQKRQLEKKLPNSHVHTKECNHRPLARPGK